MVPGYGGASACVNPGRDANSVNAARLAQSRTRCVTMRCPDYRRWSDDPANSYDSLEWGVAWAWAWHQEVPASATNRSTSSTPVANEVTRRTRVASPSGATSFGRDSVVHG